MQELWEEAAGQTDIGSSLTTNALFLKVWVRTVLFPQLNLLSHVHAVINDGWLGEGQSMPSSTLKCPIPRAGAGAAHSSRPLQGLGPCLGYRRCSLTHGTRTYCCLLWTPTARAASCPVLFLTQVAERVCYTTSGKHQALGVLHGTWCSQNPGQSILTMTFDQHFLSAWHHTKNHSIKSSQQLCGGNHCYSHFTGEETQLPAVRKTCPRPPREKWAGSTPRSVDRPLTTLLSLQEGTENVKEWPQSIISTTLTSLKGESLLSSKPIAQSWYMLGV